MRVGKLVFAQLTEHLPLTTFRRCVALYAGEHKIKNFTCLEQFPCLAFAQLTYRESLRDIEACACERNATSFITWAFADRADRGLFVAFCQDYQGAKAGHIEELRRKRSFAIGPGPCR
jgi:hypothetical protein